MKRSYMVMQDVNYQLFAESVEAECTFGIKQPNTELAEKTLEELGLISLRGTASKHTFGWAETAVGSGNLHGLRQRAVGI